MRKNSSGFTIVELLIVIVVIAILATISIVAYNGIQNRARESLLKSALSNAGKWMQTENAKNGTYPTSLSSFQGQSGVALSLSTVAGGFCINGETLNGSPLSFRNESTSGIQEGLCSGAVISGSETGINPNLVTNTDFSSGWGFNTSNSAGRSLTTRAGAMGDPYTSRPVLVLTNSATTTVAYAVVQSDIAGINYAAIEDGKTYILSYYVRKIGPFSGGGIGIGISNASGSSVTITYSNYLTISDSWQKLTKSSTATRQETGDNRVYLSINVGPFTTSGWKLEFQGFELRKF